MMSLCQVSDRVVALLAKNKYPELRFLDFIRETARRAGQLLPLMGTFGWDNTSVESRYYYQIDVTESVIEGLSC